MKNSSFRESPQHGRYRDLPTDVSTDYDNFHPGATAPYRNTMTDAGTRFDDLPAHRGSTMSTQTPFRNKVIRNQSDKLGLSDSFGFNKGSSAQNAH